MTTPEDLRPRPEQAKRATELRGQIVRASSWGQIFATAEEAELSFRNLVDEDRFYYRKNDPRVEYTVEPHPDGDIHRVVRNKGYDTTYQRLLNGDIVFTFYYPDPDKPPRVQLITPNIGNIAHPFTDADVAVPDDKVVDSLLEELEDLSLQSETIDSFLFSHLKGKPATQSWENTMLHNGYMPQRIGYKLFPGYAIEALARLREEYPQFVVAP